MPHQYLRACSVAGRALGGPCGAGTASEGPYGAWPPDPWPWSSWPQQGFLCPAARQGSREPLTSRNHTGNSVITIAEQILKVPLQIFHSVQDPRTCEQPKERMEFLTDSMKMTIRFNFFFFKEEMYYCRWEYKGNNMSGYELVIFEAQVHGGS